VERLAIDALVDAGPGFRKYFEERRYKRASIRSYSNFLATLVRAAKQLGWESSQPEVPDAWRPIFAVSLEFAGCSGIVDYAIRRGKAPSEFCDDDLDAWGEMFVKQGHCYEYTIAVKRRFRRALSESGLADCLPGICCASRNPGRYAVPVRSFPARLRCEVEALLKWKQEPYAEGRPPRGRLRPVSAKLLESCITRLYGFVTTVQGRKNISNLLELVTKESIVSFIKWSLNDRKLKSHPFAVGLGLLYSAMKWYPAYETHDFGWLRTLLSGIPPDPESEKRERKASKYLPYDVVAGIPAMIRARRETVTKQSAKQLSFLVRDELLVSWLVALVWRQRNIRECRLGRNLFKAEIPPLANVAKPKWVQERIRVNSHEQFWQFYFREAETKTSHEVRGILPHRLVPLLEEYLDHHRSVALRGADPGNLFLNRNGRPLTLSEFVYLISNLTLQYAHRRVTPHIFRDIFAYWWLEHQPEDYLTVSKVLWHKNINTTLQIYGCRFDESHGLRRVEEWLDSRDKESEHLPHSTPEEPADFVAVSHSERSRLQIKIEPARAPEALLWKKKAGGSAA